MNDCTYLVIKDLDELIHTTNDFPLRKAIENAHTHIVE